jgi:hypothetical protein
LLRPYLWMPYANRFANDTLLSNPRFVIRDVSNFEFHGRDLLKVDFDFFKDPPSEERRKVVSDSKLFEGFFLVCPGQKWVLYEYEWRAKTGDPQYVFKGDVEYQGTLDDFPIMKRVTRRRLRLPGREVAQTQTYDFLEFLFTDVPEQEFTLSAFGIPEAVSQPAEVTRSNRLGHWFLGLSVVALGAAVLSRFALSRLKRHRGEGWGRFRGQN